MSKQIKYQDPNFDKFAYNTRRAHGQRGQKKYNPNGVAYPPDTWKQIKEIMKKEKQIATNK